MVDIVATFKITWKYVAIRDSVFPWEQAFGDQSERFSSKWTLESVARYRNNSEETDNFVSK